MVDLPQVRLIAISKPVIDDVPDSAALLAFCARVSSSANQMNHETGSKLLRSLIRRKEWSPFEMVSLTIEIVTTRDIGRQILRHRSFSFQEFSQRYAVVSDFSGPREARLQHPTDRQKSLSEGVSPANATWWANRQRRLLQKTTDLYREALNRGIAKENARVVLPEGLTVSRLYMAGTLRSWMHYVMLRATEATQKEHRQIAEQVVSILRLQFPDLADLINVGEND